VVVGLLRLSLFRYLAAFDRVDLSSEMVMSDRDLIRASEIADWCFCKRSWYLNDQDVRPNLVQVEKRDAGIHYHEQHARTVKRARTTMSTATYALLLVLLVAVAYWFWTKAR
jgi:hypothetical protein